MLGVSVIAVNSYSCYHTFIGKFGSDLTGDSIRPRMVSEWELRLPRYHPAIFLFCILILVHEMWQSIIQLSFNKR